MTIPDKPPQSRDELFAMILLQMKEDLNNQLKKRDEAIASLSLCVPELQKVIKKQQTEKKMDSAGNTADNIDETTNIADLSTGLPDSYIVLVMK